MRMMMMMMICMMIISALDSAYRSENEMHDSIV